MADKKPSKAELIKQFMDLHGMIREDAEFHAAVELGESQGDVVELEGENANSNDD